MFFKIKIYDLVKNLIDILIIFFTCILCIKKGGYYISDSQFYVNYIFLIVIIYIINEVFNWFNNRKNKVIEDSKSKLFTKKNIIIILSSLLGFAYAMPILFNTYIEYTEALWEMFKYFILFILIYIVSNSNNKKIYIINIIFLGVIQVIFGIDGISSRIFSDFLSNINSGYLSKDLDRLSGTIQYANLAGLIFLISSILILKYINLNIDKLDNKINKLINKNSMIVIINNVFFMLFSICILLTKSKMILVMYIISMLIIIFKNKGLIKLNILINIILSFIATTNIEDLIYIDVNKIYFTVFSYIILSLLISYYFLKYIVFNVKIKEIYSNTKFKINKATNKIKYKSVLTVILIILTLLILTLFTTTLKLTQTSNSSNVSRTYYDIKEGKNTFNILFKTLQNSSFSITVYAIDENSNKIYLENHSLSDESQVDICKIDINNTEKYKGVVLEFNEIVGIVEIKEILLNNNKQVIEYMLLPTDLIFRINDVIHFNSTSITDRIEYNKDALKIWNESKLIGFGGEAFRHKYKEVQTLKYTSREVHNVYFQILVESGIIGFVIIISVIILTLKVKADLYIKLSFIIFIIHNIFDLNFSYMIGVVIFAMIIGYINNKLNSN